MQYLISEQIGPHPNVIICGNLSSTPNRLTGNLGHKKRQLMTVHDNKMLHIKHFGQVKLHKTTHLPQPSVHGTPKSGLPHA